MSLVLTVQIEAGTHEEVREKLQTVSDMVREEFPSHAQSSPEDGSYCYRLTDKPEEPTN